MGCEVLSGNAGYVFANVSIHAPVWGAKNANMTASGIETFQSTHPCGVRNNMVAIVLLDHSFNPRTRVGCEFFVKSAVKDFGSFNPRTRVGCEILTQQLLQN